MHERGTELDGAERQLKTDANILKNEDKIENRETGDASTLQEEV